ncbi:MAG: hypothetical protein ABIN67_22220 [Ferruginibacter sp.]
MIILFAVYCGRLLKTVFFLRIILTIYQAIIDFDYVVADGINKIVFDNRLTTPHPPDKIWLLDPDNYADFARINLKNYLGNSLTNGSYALTVFLLNQQTEKNILYTDLDSNDNAFINNFLQAF